MRCLCGSDSMVTTTRTSDSDIKRHRRCKSCNITWTTIEVRSHNLVTITLAEAKAVVAAREGADSLLRAMDDHIVANHE